MPRDTAARQKWLPMIWGVTAGRVVCGKKIAGCGGEIAGEGEEDARLTR